MKTAEAIEILSKSDGREVLVRYVDRNAEVGLAEVYGYVSVDGEGVAGRLVFSNAMRIPLWVVESIELPQWCCFDPDPQTDPRSRYWDGPIRCSECGREWDGEQEAGFRGIPDMSARYTRAFILQCDDCDLCETEWSQKDARELVLADNARFHDDAERQVGLR